MANPYDDVVNSWQQEKGTAAAPVSANPYDSVVGAMQEERQQTVRSVFEKALATNPDQAAENKRLADTTGLSFEMVERNKDEIQRKQQARMLDLARMAQDSPVLARQLIDPTFTKQTHDHLDNLSALEQTFNVARALPAGAATGMGSAISGLGVGIDVAARATGLTAVSKAVRDLTGADLGVVMDVAGSLKFVGGGWKMLGDAIGPAPENKNFMTDVSGGIGQLMQQIGVQIATGGTASLVSLFAQGADAMNEKVKGDNGSQALKDTAIIAGASITALTEKYGVDALLNRVPPAIKNSALRWVADKLAAAGIEATQEIAEGVLQDTVRVLLTNNEAKIGENVAYEAGVAGTSAAIVRAALGVRVRSNADIQQQRVAEADAARLQEQFSLASGALLRDRNPEQFRALVQSMADQTEGAPSEVYIDAEVLNQLAPEVLDQLPGVAEQMADALATNSVVSIQMGDVLAMAPGTPLEAMLVEHARIGDVTAMSQFEAKEAGAKAQEFLAQESQRVIAQAVDQQAMQESSDRVKQGVLDQLNTVGRFRKDVNEGYATWTAAFYTTMAGRLGVTPEQMAQQYPLRITGQSGQGATLKAGKVGEIAVEGFHFSKADRSVVSTSMYGTGLQGSNRELFKNAKDKRLGKRAYFYADTGTGINPEAGVGGRGHKAQLTNVYDSNTDPLRLKGGSQEDFESKVLDAGFNGYLDRMTGTQSGQVIMLGDQNINVESLGGLGKTSGARVAPAGTREAKGRDVVVDALNTNTALPAGSPTLARWQQLLAKDPGTLQALTDAGVFAGDQNESVYKSELVKRFTQATPAEAYSQTTEGDVNGRVQQAGNGSGRPTGRDLAPLEGAPSVPGFQGPDPRIVDVAEQYARDNGIDLKRQADYVKVDPERAARIAAAYEAMAHSPQDPAVKEAYDNLIKQTLAQYQALEAAGYKFWFIDFNQESNAQYASSPWNAMRDMRANQQMGVFPTNDGFGSGDFNPEANPLLADTGLQWPVGGPDGPLQPVLANDLFRAVHDAFGHGMEGAGFRADGEENAWQAHSRLFTGSALGAITSETRGQNSWLNFGPNGENNRTAKVEDTVFADQKTGLMPEWTWSEGRAGDMQDDGALNQDTQLLAPNGKPSNLTPAQHALVRTPEFKAWFGDWEAFAGVEGGVWSDTTNSVSKAVDENGEPLVVYHGTDKGGFTEFNKPGGNRRGDLGIFLSSNREMARSYVKKGRGQDLAREDLNGNTSFFGSKSGIYPLFVNIRNPNETDFEGANWDGQRREQYEVTDESGDQVYAADGRGYLSEDEANTLAENTPGATVDPAGDHYESTDSVVREARASNDGAIIRNVMDDGGGNSSYTGEPSDVFVALDPTQVKSVDNFGTFNPNDANILKQGPRGTFSPASLELALNENADLSTFLHETGHFFLEVMADVSSQPNAPADIQQDMAALMQWFGVADLATWNGYTLDQKRPYHERFAESFEQYLMEGKAPSLELQPLFRKFRAWMLNVYKSLKAFVDSRVAVTSGGDSLAQSVYHGTPHRGISKFSTDKMGTGEGAQAYGWGLYFASKKEIAEAYRTTLTDEERATDSYRASYEGNGATSWWTVAGWGVNGGYQGSVRVNPDADDEQILREVGAAFGPNVAADFLKKVSDENLEDYVLEAKDLVGEGQLYKADIPEDNEMLLWDKSLSEQPPAVQNGLAKLDADTYAPEGSDYDANEQGQLVYQRLQAKLGSAKAASEYLARLGVKGIKYLDGTSRKAGEGSYNYVIFDGGDVSIEQTFYQGDQPAGPNIQLSDEVRQVFDRMIASEEQITQANEVAGLLPNEDADAEAVEKLTARSLRDLKWTVNARAKAIKALQKQAAELRKGVEAEVRAEVEAQPIYRAMQWLRKGEMTDEAGNLVKAEKGFRLATEVLGEMFPETMLGRPDLTRLKGMTLKGGLHPDLVADMFGFESGDALVRNLIDAEPLASVVDGITDQRMLEQHGDLIDQRAIEAAANEAVHNEARARSLATELRSQAEMLNPRTDTGEVNAKGSKITVNAIVEAAKQFAADVVSRTPLRDLKAKAWQHTAAERRAGKRWKEATVAGQTQDAVKAKQDQVLNNAAAKAAIDAQVEMRKILTFFKRVIKDNNEKTVDKGRDPDVVNAARAILGAYGVAPKGAKSAAEYMDLVAKNDPAMFAALQPSVQGALNMAQPLDALTMDELRGLHEEIQAMWHLAKRSRQMEVDGNLMDMQDAEDELQSRMQSIGVPLTIPGESSAITPREKASRALQFAGSLLRRAEQWAEGMGSEFTNLVFQPVKDAANAYRADRVVYRKAYQGLVDNVAPALVKGPIAAPELGYTFGLGHNGIGHAELLHAILHTGNTSNKRKLLLGRGWATENADGTMDTSKWDAFLTRMHDTGILNKAHYDFAQGVWNLLEQTKPLAQKTHRDVFGRYFAEVTADSFTTPFGDYAGGYVPAQADPRIVQDAALRDLATSENENMAFSFPGTNKGFTKGRVEYNRPLMLDLRTIGQHIDKVLLFSHMEPAVRDVNKLLSRKGVSYSLGRIDPTIYAGMLTPWLNRSARQIVETPIVGDGGISRVLSAARNRAGMALMFANVSNAIQQTTGFLTAMSKLKSDGLESHMTRATVQFIKSPKQTAKAVGDASPFMATRMENEIAAINDAMDQILLNPSLYEKAQAWTQKHAYFLQSALANSMEPIIWTAGYNAALEKGLDEKEAVRYADGLIRQTQGSTLPEDVSRLETGPAYARVFTQFIGYFNMMANTNATALKQLAAEVGLKKGAGKAIGIVTLGMLAPIWMAEAIAQAMRGGPDDEDKDGYLDDWLMAVFGMGTLKGTLAMVPFVGQLGNAAINRFNGNPADDKMSLSPAVSLLEAAVGVPVDVYKAITDPDKLNKRNAVRDVASLVSIATGLPAVAVARPLGYLAGVEQGRIDPTSAGDMARGLVTGTPSPASK